MQIQTLKTITPLTWAVAVAVIIFSVVGTAAMMGWLPESVGGAVGQSSQSVPTATKQEASPAKAVCVDCGVIESVQELTSKGAGTGLGAVGGAVIGGVLGHQIGGGRGKDLATVAGAVGGAVAGNEIEKQVKVSKRYEISVLFDDGTRRLFTETHLPGWRAGDRVKIINGTITSGS